MRRILLAAVLAVAGVLGTATAASADVGDITFLSVQHNDSGDGTAITGTAETAEVEGEIRCTTGIEYGLIVKVAQPEDGIDDIEGEDDNDSDVEGVGAFGPNAGNEANSPCSTNLQTYELVVERNRDSGTFQNTTDEGTGVFVLAGTSAENGDRGPGPFIGDLEITDEDVDFERTDP